MAGKLRWSSNHQQVADRELFVGRVRGGELEMANDTKAGTFVGVYVEPDASDPPVDPLPDTPIILEITMPSYPETQGDTIIPMGVDHTIYELTESGGSPEVISWEVGPGTKDYQSGNFLIQITEGGSVSVSQADGTETSNPADAATQDLLVFSSYKTKNIVNGVDVISPAKGPMTIRIKGATTGADVTPPTPVSLTPGGISVAITSSVAMTMSEPIQAGSGVVQLWNTTLNSLIEEFDVTTDIAGAIAPGKIVITGSQITVKTTSDLPNATGVSFRMDAGAVKDLATSPNNCAAITDDTWAFITAAAAVPSDFSPDVTVSSAAAINSTLTAWAADPAGTAPSGKAALDDRVIGYDTTLTGLTISSKNMPMRVFIRPVGTYNTDFTCSVYIQGSIAITGSTNIVMWRNDLRAPSGTFSNPGWYYFTGSTNCGSMYNSVRGQPFTLSQGFSGTTSAGLQIHGTTTDFTIAWDFYRYCKEHNIKLDGNHTRTKIVGYMARHTGGNDIVLSSTSTTNDLSIKYAYADRMRHPAPGLHADFLQANRSAVINGITVEYCAHLRGHWTRENAAGANGCQNVFLTDQTSSGAFPVLFDNCIVMSGQQRGVDRPNGAATLHVNDSTFLPGNYPSGQDSTAPFPRPLGATTANTNIVGAPASDGTYATGEGTGGIRVNCSSGNPEILTYQENIPTDLTTLYEVRPKAGAATHPAFGGTKVGGWRMWEKLINQDTAAVPLFHGWPVDRVFSVDFDPTHQFGPAPASYDSNGDRV